MPTLYDSSGKPYDLSVEVGRGGEGTVFFCPGDPTLVAKLYHEPIDDEKAEKLRWMAANRNEGLSKVAAWVTDTLHDRAGHTVGFLMPNVKAKEIHELYSLKSRRVHFPEATWQFLLHAAANVARGFYVLHKNDHIMGDVNHGNCVVLADGTVKLIDCDSYSIRTDKMRYRCDVGVATHLAPELQGVDLSRIERQKTHDNFGLAVIIFQLLFLGRHPFSGNYLSAEDKSLEDCIREYRFAYGDESITQVKQPPGTLSLSQVSVRVAMMFDRAFTTKDRPEAREWIEALEDLSASLKQCSVHIGHHYFNGLTTCPWCEIESKTGLLLFPFIIGKEFANEFNIFTVENLLASLEIPENLPAKPFKPYMLPPPSPEAVGVFRESIENFVGLMIVELILVVGISMYSPGCAFVFGLITMTLFLITRNQSMVKASIDDFRRELNSAAAAWEYFGGEWLDYNRNQDFSVDFEVVRHKINDYHSLQKEKTEQARMLTEDAYRYQLEIYLRSRNLGQTSLPGIGTDELDEFKRFGIRTAADFDARRLKSLLALDEKTKDGLLRWRRQVEREFEFDPKQHIGAAAQTRLDAEFASKRRTIEKEIEQLLVVLRSVSAKLRQQQQQLTAKAATLAQAFVQAESNFTKVNHNFAMTVALVLTPIFVPLCVSVFQTVPNTSNSDLGMANRSVDKVVARPVSTSDANVYPNTDPNFKVNENVNHREISQMSANERYKSARVLYARALKQIDQHDNKKAEKTLRLAIKFVDYDPEILYTLASLLYDQVKYDESISFLEKALKVDPGHENSKLLLGAIYLKMGMSDRSEELFQQVVDDNPQSFEAHYNLGLVYEKTNSFSTAKDSFKRAVDIDPENVDAIYKYGFCLYKTGEQDAGYKQYIQLLSLNKTKAEKLRVAIKAEPRLNY